jgi:hypothetical protein
MDASLLIVLIIPFGIMVIGWFVLVHSLHRALAKSSPDLFASMGKPSLFGRGSLVNDRRLIQLISGRGTAGIGDPALVLRLRFMRAYAIVMLLVFLGFA